MIHDQIDNVQQHSNRRWYVTPHPQEHEVYTEITCIKKLEHELEKIVKITDPLEMITTVTVHKVSMYLSQQKVIYLKRLPSKRPFRIVNITLTNKTVLTFGPPLSPPD